MERDSSQSIEPPNSIQSNNWYHSIILKNRNNRHLLRNLPFPLFTKEGELILPLAKGGEEGFSKKIYNPFNKPLIKCISINYNVA